MLGRREGCGGPVSWWCSEAWRCSPRVSPTCTAARTPEMTDCDQCSARFSLLKRKRTCDDCGLVFCSSCIKRGNEGKRRCNKCMVLCQWPLDTTKVEALRVKDLRHFLHSQHINTVSCTEKRDLIDLVTRHICSKHRGASCSPPRTNVPSNNSSNIRYSMGERPQYKPATSPVTRDDGIRVRPCGASSDTSGRDSIRVRPLDSIRVRAGPPTSPSSYEYDPEVDLGIRVFASESSPTPQQRANSVSPVSAEGYSESVEECSRCPSEECTTSCCSLDSCPNGASSQPCPHRAGNSSHCSLEDVSISSEGQFPSSASPDMAEPSERPSSSLAQDHTQSIQDQGTEESQESHRGMDPVVEITPEVPIETVNMDYSREDSPPPNTLDEDPQVPSATSPSSASSSTFPSESSSPEPVKQFGPGIVALSDLKCEEDISRLSIRQCKEVLAFHRVNLAGVREKSELVSKIVILWKDFQSNHPDVDGLPEELVCKICMDSVIDCVLLECGHMVACTQCGKQMAECPVCRQFVVRVVRTFRA